MDDAEQRHCSSSGITKCHTENTSKIGKSKNSSSSQVSIPASLSPELVLIDVDCNLWHPDLRRAVPSAFVNTNVDNNDNNDNDDNDDCFAILEHDAVHESNIKAFLSPSSTLEDARYGIEQLRRYYTAPSKEKTEYNRTGPSKVAIRTTVGVHPYNVPQPQDHGHEDGREDTFVRNTIAQDAMELIVSNRDIVVGVGECGLDRSDGFPPLDVQLPWFQCQVDLCQLLQTQQQPQSHPFVLFVHERLAFQEVFELLQKSSINPLSIIIHCFTGTISECEQYIAAGYSISLSGYVFRDQAGTGGVIDCLESGIIPLDRLMIETDAPYMGFNGGRSLFLEKNQQLIASTLNSKQRKKFAQSTYPNVPSSLVKVLQKVLDHLNIGRQTRNKKRNGIDSSSFESLLSLEELAYITSQNANQFFNFGLSYFSEKHQKSYHNH